MVRSRMRLLASRLLRPVAAPALDEVTFRLEQARRAADYWKRRFHRRTTEVERLRGTIEQLRQRIQQLNRRARIRKRNQLTQDVLLQLLPERVRQRPLLASDVGAAVERAQRLEGASAEYGASIRDPECRREHIERVEMSGIFWWLPRDEALAGRSGRLQGQSFPLRAILQTRELAIGGLMLDIGANIGRTSIPRILLGDVRAVYAAEPEPVNYACLVENIVEHRLCGYVLPDRVAIGSARGEVRLRRSRYVGGHRVLRESATRDADVDTVSVALWPLDEWLPHLGVEPGEVGFVKVDTQGFELDVLRGASALLARRHVAWQLEVDPGLLARAGTSLEELIAALQPHFSHFIDIGGRLEADRVRPVTRLGEALDYVGSVQNKTDIVLYNAAP